MLARSVLYLRVVFHSYVKYTRNFAHCKILKISSHCVELREGFGEVCVYNYIHWYVCPGVVCDSLISQAALRDANVHLDALVSYL